jgi:hypothetical protein
MPSEIMQNVLQLIEAEAQSRYAPVEFEIAYQARVAMDRIRFAVKHTEQFGPRTDQMREVVLQLLDALDRLESGDRSFQKRLRAPRELRDGRMQGQPLSGKVDQSSNEAPYEPATLSRSATTAFCGREWVLRDEEVPLIEDRLLRASEVQRELGVSRANGLPAYDGWTPSNVSF